MWASSVERVHPQARTPSSRNALAPGILARGVLVRGNLPRSMSSARGGGVDRSHSACRVVRCNSLIVNARGGRIDRSNSEEACRHVAHASSGENSVTTVTQLARGGVANSCALARDLTEAAIFAGRASVLFRPCAGRKCSNANMGGAMVISSRALASGYYTTIALSASSLSLAVSPSTHLSDTEISRERVLSK